MAQDKILPGYPQSIGAKIQSVTDHYGPVSYNNVTGDVYSIVGTQNQGGFDKVIGGPTLSGIYQVDAILGSGAVGVGAPTVTLRWSALYLGAVIGVTITSGGTYVSPTVPTVTFAAAPAGGITATGTAIMNGAGTAVVGVNITNPGKGYVSPPTVTFSGGTAATGTATISIPGEVASGTDLSSEVVRLEMIMY